MQLKEGGGKALQYSAGTLYFHSPSFSGMYIS